MSAPITWRNVNQPNFSASNTLALAASRQLGNAFDSGSQRLIDQGQFNKEKNTGEALAQLSGFNDLDSFANDRAQLMASLEGANIDRQALVEAGDDRRGLLQDNVNFDLDHGIKQFTMENQGDVLQSKLAREQSLINQANLQGQQIQQNIDQSALDRTPEALQAAVDAEKAMLTFKTDEKIREDYGSSGTTTGLNNAYKPFTENPAWGGVGEVGARKAVEDLKAEFSEYKGLSNKEWTALLRRNTIPPSATNSDADLDKKQLIIDATNAILAKGKPTQ